MTRDELVERMARAVCKERCAYFGDPPCWSVVAKWRPNICIGGHCDDIATAALTELEKHAVVTPRDA